MHVLPHQCRSNEQLGFTLVELIATMIIIGVLAAMVLPRFSGTHGFEERGLYDETIAALRYAQKSAISHRRQVCVVVATQSIIFTIASTQPAASSTTCENPLPGPDGSVAFTVNAAAGSKYSNASLQIAPVAALGNFTFDALGRASAARVFTVSSASDSFTINVEAETGYVY